jgi:hypothetical protein
MKVMSKVLDGLDSVCGRIDLERPSLETVRAWLSKLRFEKSKAQSSAGQVAVIVLGVMAVVWWLMS